MEIKKSKLVKLFQNLGLRAAHQWSDAILQGRVDTIHTLYGRDAEAGECTKTFIRLWEASKNEEDIIIVDDKQEDAATGTKSEKKEIATKQEQKKVATKPEYREAKAEVKAAPPEIKSKKEIAVKQKTKEKPKSEKEVIKKSAKAKSETTSTRNKTKWGYVVGTSVGDVSQYFIDGHKATRHDVVQKFKCPESKASWILAGFVASGFVVRDGNVYRAATKSERFAWVERTS
jgi:hypothetical protein